MHVIDKEAHSFVNSKYDSNLDVTEDKQNNINIYYEMQMTDNYKEEEKLLENIVINNTSPIECSKKI